MRAERQRQSLAAKKNKGVKPVPEKLARAIKSRISGLQGKAKGLRVGKSLDTTTALRLQKRAMVSSMKDMSRYKGHANPQKM